MEVDEPSETTSEIGKVLLGQETNEDYPRILDESVDIEQLTLLQMANYSLHARARRARVIQTLSNRATMLYLTLASGSSMETVRMRLLRLLDPERSVDETEDWERMMTCGLPFDRIPPHLRG